MDKIEINFALVWTERDRRDSAGSHAVYDGRAWPWAGGPRASESSGNRGVVSVFAHRERLLGPSGNAGRVYQQMGRGGSGRARDGIE